MEGGNAYLVMWKCVFGNGNMRFWLCKDTGAMNLPLRLAECSRGISWVDVECLRSVREVFVGGCGCFMDC